MNRRLTSKCRWLVQGLREFADFDAKLIEKKDAGGGTRKKEEKPVSSRDGSDVREIRLGYTINLNLPQTSDISVFNAIVKSLKENLL